MSRAVHRFADAEALAQGVAQRLVDAIGASQGRFTLALSGGSSPKRLFEVLAQHHADDIAWEQVHVFWGDERCVPPDHADSNFAMAQAALLDRVPLPPGNVHRMPAEQTPPTKAAEVYAHHLQQFFALPPGQLPRFDLILQGLGEDGHTASLFPGTAALEETRRWVTEVHAPQVSPPWRLSLTFPVLGHAKRVWFLVTGHKKDAVLRRIFADAEAAAADYPAARLDTMASEPQWFIEQ